MRPEVRLGLVGCGRVAERGYVPALALARGVRLAAVADVDQARCRETAPGVQAYESAEAVVAAGAVDALVLATPAAAHLDDARFAARAGIRVLVEKPPAPGLAQARELAAVRPLPWVGFNRRFDPGLERLRAAAAGHERVDLLLELRYRRSAWSPYVVADDVLDDLGTHLVDLARWIVGREVARVRTLELSERRASFELDLEGSRARLVCASDRGHREAFVLRDADGHRLAGHTLDRVRGGLRRLRSPRRPNSLVDSLARQLEALARAVQGGGKPHPATAVDGLAVMAALDVTRRSAAEGGSWIAVARPTGDG